MRWLKGLPYQIKLDEINVNLCHGSPVRLEEFEYIFAPEQARECLPLWDKLGHITLIGHSHLCKVFALTKSSVEEMPAVDFELAPDKKYIVFKAAKTAPTPMTRATIEPSPRIILVIMREALA